MERDIKFPTYIVYENEDGVKVFEVLFKPKGKKTRVPAETTILSAAVEMGLKLRHNCGGSATCGTCRVRIEEGVENLSSPNQREHELLGEDRIAQNYRLACQSKVLGPITVQIPSWLPILPTAESADSQTNSP